MWEKPGVLYLDFILFLLPKAKENISELLGNFILGEENKNDIYQLPMHLLGRKEEKSSSRYSGEMCVFVCICVCIYMCEKVFLSYIFLIIFVTLL